MEYEIKSFLQLYAGNDMLLCARSFFHCTSLAYDKILNMTKLRAFAYDKPNVAEIMTTVFDREENIVR